MRISDWSSGRVLFRSVRTRMVRVLLLEAVDGGQRLLGLAVFPVDISLIDERLLGISAKRVARFNGLEASACVVPVSGTDFGTCVLIQALGAPARSGVFFNLGRAAAGNQDCRDRKSTRLNSSH